MSGKFQNTLYTGDNLYVLNGMNSESVDLIYLDPPFNSKRTYSAPIGSKAAGASFKDMWAWDDVDEAYLEGIFTNFPFLVRYIQSIEGIHSKAMMAYVTYMAQRLIELHRVLKKTGSVYVHVDPTASHYLKLIMDRIFGKECFRNEIIWYYRRWTAASKQFQRMHDIILWYSRSKDYFFSKPLQDYSHPEFIENTVRGVVDGKLVRLKDEAGNYLEREKSNEGVLMHDVWTDINFIGPTSKERTGYPTQKPLALLRRIIESSSHEGDVIFDPFCGCATACVAAQQLNRNWIGIDIEEQAAQVLVDRLSDDAGLFKDFSHRLDIPERTDVKKEPPSQGVKDRLYKDQEGICNGCRNEYLVKDFHIDHIVPKSRGGGDYYENFQLLCGNCNSIKGNRPMEYLMMKVKRREDLLKSSLTFNI